MAATPKLIDPPDQIVTLLDASVTANESSDHLLALGAGRYAVQTWRTPSTGTAKVDIQASLDGVHWVSVAAAIDADSAYIQLTGVYRYLRAVRDNTTDPVTVLICRETLRW